MPATKIEWTDFSINFFTGCTKVSEGCKFCYMYRDQERYGKDPKEVVPVQDKTIQKTLREATPGSKIFVSSWTDFFIEEGDQYRAAAWDVIRSRPDLIWQILTKRPERIEECLPEDWGDGWPNVWLGVSAENQKRFDERVYQLIMIPAAKRFISVEPIVGKIDLSGFLCKTEGMLRCPIHWVIVGGESGNDTGNYLYRKSELSWYYKVVNQCKSNGVPVFVKQLGTYLSKYLELSDRHGKLIEEFPEGIQIRQFPK